MAKKLFFLVLIVVGSIFFLSLEADANRAASHEGRKEKIGNHLIVDKNSSRRLESKNEQNVQGLVHRESAGHEKNKETIADEKFKGEENDHYEDDECSEDQECDNNDDDDDDDDDDIDEEDGDECGEDQECDNNGDNEDDDECGEDQDCDNDDHDGDGENDEDECNKDGDDGDDETGDEEGGENTPRRLAKRGDVKPQIKNRGNALRGRAVHDKPPCAREVNKPHK